LRAIVDDCLAQGAKQVLTAVVLEKNRERSTTIKADFTGLQVPDRYVFGFGMDYKEYWRALPAVYAVKEHG
jgi:hypoxanthine phosphoribosyltransferase